LLLKLIITQEFSYGVKNLFYILDM